jgi:hypothetical protein
MSVQLSLYSFFLTQLQYFFKKMSMCGVFVNGPGRHTREPEPLADGSLVYKIHQLPHTQDPTMTGAPAAVGHKRKGPPSHTSGDSFDSVSSRRQPAGKKQKASVGVATDRGGKANQEVRVILHLYMQVRTRNRRSLQHVTCWHAADCVVDLFRLSTYMSDLFVVHYIL